jgi:hypothetical protein
MTRTVRSIIAATLIIGATPVALLSPALEAFAATADELQAPRSAPDDQGQAPRFTEEAVQAPRAQEIQAPRSEDEAIQAPRSPRPTRA